MVTWVLFFSLFFSKQNVLSFSAPSLTVEVSNIKHKDKELRIAVCQKIHFLKDTPPFKFMLINTHNAIESATFVLPKGSYAISVFHDLNGNGKLDKNMFGAPKEPYGFSRNYKPFMRAPRFEEVVVEISEQDKKTSIQLIHP